jgi:hypothetical protein
MIFISWPSAEIITTQALSSAVRIFCSAVMPSRNRHGDIHRRQIGPEFQIFFHGVLAVRRLGDHLIALLFKIFRRFIRIIKESSTIMIFFHNNLSFAKI